VLYLFSAHPRAFSIIPENRIDRMSQTRIPFLTSRFGAAMASFAAFVTAALPARADNTILGQPAPWEIGLQPSVSPVKDQMIHFHDKLLLPITTAIVLFVLGLLIYVVIRFNEKSNPVPSKTTHNTLLEVIWTLVPVIILVLIVVPSMKMLYYADRTEDADMTLKVTGYQWYWGYEYPDNGGVNFTSNLVPESDLKPGQPRLLATDNPVVLPVDTNIRILVTGNDVIHSWALPAFGVKIDAVPGRTNETWARIEKEGTYYGQCSEICGVNHGFMPIEIKAVSKADFAKWVVAQGGKMPAVTHEATPASAVDTQQGPEGTPAATPAEKAVKAPAEMTPTDKDVNEAAQKEGNVAEKAAKKVAEPMPQQKAGEQ
jgi:cytochrome c oxidase subunit 2